MQKLTIFLISFLCLSHQKTFTIKTSDSFNNIERDLNYYLSTDFSTIHEIKFTDFLEKELVEKYPHFQQVIDNGISPATAPQTGSIGSSDPGEENDWIESKGAFSQKGGVANYIKDVKNQLKSFTKEFSRLKDILKKLKYALPNMPSDDLKKIRTNENLTNIESRLNHYKKACEIGIMGMQAKFEKNMISPTAPVTTEAGTTQIALGAEKTRDKYQSVHENFMKFLDTAIIEPIDNFITELTTIKDDAERNQIRK